MQNNDFSKKHLKGSSGPQERKKRPDESMRLPRLTRIHRVKESTEEMIESVPIKWLKGLRPIQGNRKDSLRNAQIETLREPDHEIKNQSDDVGRWQDDGGESGEEV